MQYSPKTHLYVVQTTVVRDEGCDLLSVLDELYSDTLSDGRVWLFSLNSTGNKRKIHIILYQVFGMFCGINIT